MTANSLIEAAIADCASPVTIAGETQPKGNGMATSGRFQVYVVRVGGGAKRPHHRITFYLRDAAGAYRRVSREAFEAELAK